MSSQPDQILEAEDAELPDELVLQGRLTTVLSDNPRASALLAWFKGLDGENYRVRGDFSEADKKATELTLRVSPRQTDNGITYDVEDIWRGPNVQGEVTAEDVEAFAAEFFQGHYFGPAAARKLVDEFGERSWTVLADEPHTLADYLGDKAKAFKLNQVLLDAGLDRAKALAKLMGLGLSLAYAKRVLDWMGGQQAVDAVAEDPYSIIDVDGIGFKTADKMALEGYGLAPTDPRRLKAMAVNVLEEAASDGHTSLNEGEVIQEIDELIREEDADYNPHQVLQEALEDEELVADRGDIYLPRMHKAEREAAEGLVRMLFGQHRSLPEGYVRESAFQELDPKQQEAVVSAWLHPISVITGAAGTGKTTVVREIVYAAQRENVDVRLAATTAKAADRLTEAVESTDFRGPSRAAIKPVGKAQTIHSLTGWGKGRDMRLPSGIVIVDEASMMDLPMLARLLRCIELNDHTRNPDTTLVLIGDPNQLPSVVAGSVLRDVCETRDHIDREHKIAHVELDTVHRAGKHSLLSINANRILEGGQPFYYSQGMRSFNAKTLQKLSEMFPGEQLTEEDINVNVFKLPCEPIQFREGSPPPWYEIPPEEEWTDEEGEPEELPEFGAQNVLLALHRLQTSDEYDYDMKRDVQVFTPMHKGEMGTKSLNRRIQAFLNPDGAKVAKTDKRGLELRVGDPVLQTRNDRQHKGVVNGMRGVIVALTDEDGIVVDFDGESVRYTGGEVRELSLAYATTVHKAQGQEHPVSIFALHHGEHWPMLNRNLLYVGSTRATEKLIYVTTDTALWRARTEEVKDQRHSQLTERFLDRYEELYEELAGEQLRCDFNPDDLGHAPTRNRQLELIEDAGPKEPSSSGEPTNRDNNEPRAQQGPSR